MASAPRRRLGKYELCARLGSGGQAEVFLALLRGQAGFNKLVVIKKLLAGVGEDAPIRVSRFLDEARLAARLNHPNVVHTYDVGEDGGQLYIAMEYVEGQSLQTIQSKLGIKGKFTIGMYVRVLIDVLDAHRVEPRKRPGSRASWGIGSRAGEEVAWATDRAPQCTEGCGKYCGWT
jgi:serine/threonine-protein kinase